MAPTSLSWSVLSVPSRSTVHGVGLFTKPIILLEGIHICVFSPITGARFPEGFRKLWFPDYVTMAQDGGKVVSLTRRPLLPPMKYSWYSFLLEAESTPGPLCDRKDYVNAKIPTTPSGNRNSDLPICSAAP